VALAGLILIGIATGAGAGVAVGVLRLSEPYYRNSPYLRNPLAGSGHAITYRQTIRSRPPYRVGPRPLIVSTYPGRRVSIRLPLLRTYLVGPRPLPLTFAYP
jgi:hypothetical protein